MSSRNFLDGDHKQQLKSGIVINGPRPSPLKLKQESHTIHKHPHHLQQKHIRKPVIIYIRSPEIIHTKPHEFMDLVQKLTGHSGDKDQEKQKKKKKKETRKQVGYDLNVNELSNESGVTHESLKLKSRLFKMPSNPYVADIPHFTPNASDFFLSPQRLLSPGCMIEIMKELP